MGRDLGGVGGELPTFTTQELDLLALIATARSGGADQEAPFKAARLIKDARDGWTDLTAKGEAVLERAGFEYLPKSGWTRTSSELSQRVGQADDSL